jgi:hypothetical protein
LIFQRTIISFGYLKKIKIKELPILGIWKKLESKNLPSSRYFENNVIKEPSVMGIWNPLKNHQFSWNWFFLGFLFTSCLTFKTKFHVISMVYTMNWILVWFLIMAIETRTENYNLRRS